MSCKPVLSFIKPGFIYRDIRLPKLFATERPARSRPRTAFVNGTVRGNPLNGFYAEKSTRDVYDALNMDFDALENGLSAITKI
jgi:hypothetical protein